MIPSYQKFYVPVLMAMKDRGLYNRHQVADVVSEKLKLTEE